MAVSGDRVLERGAATGLETLAALSGAERPDPEVRRRRTGARPTSGTWAASTRRSGGSSRSRCSTSSSRSRGGGAAAPPLPARGRAGASWLGAQEHQRFYLLQQNEASDWADIMPRSGFVLYTNALWYRVKRLFGLPNAAATRANFNGLFHPFSAGLAEYRRARLLNEYARKRARNRDLYLSFVNFSFFGDEGDVFGNVLAVLCGALSRERRAPHARRVAREPRARAVPGSRRRAADPQAERALAPVHGAPSAELRVAVPQRRRLADGGRVLGRGACALRAKARRRASSS